MSPNAEMVVLAHGISSAEISTLLRMAPDKSYDEGDPILDQRTGLMVGAKRATRWALTSKTRVASNDLDDHIQVLLDLVQPHAEEVRDLAEGANVFFWVFWESDSLDRGDGPILSSNVCKEIGGLGAGLQFDIYCTLAHGDDVKDADQ